jgi:hypothetical protein
MTNNILCYRYVQNETGRVRFFEFVLWSLCGEVMMKMWSVGECWLVFFLSSLIFLKTLLADGRNLTFAVTNVLLGVRFPIRLFSSVWLFM